MRVSKESKTSSHCPCWFYWLPNLAPRRCLFHRSAGDGPSRGTREFGVIIVLATRSLGIFNKLVQCDVFLVLLSENTLLIQLATPSFLFGNHLRGDLGVGAFGQDLLLHEIRLHLYGRPSMIFWAYASPTPGRATSCSFVAEFRSMS